MTPPNADAYNVANCSLAGGGAIGVLVNYQLVQSELLRRLTGSSVSAQQVIAEIRGRAADDPDIEVKLVGSLLSVSVERQEATRLVTELLEHHRWLCGRFGSEVDLRVSAMDYATRHPEVIDEPVVVDQPLLALSQRLAAVDELTGLFNRRFLDVYLAKELKRAQRHGETFSILFVDLDDFKTVNDTHGHAAGDRVLETAGREIQALLREEDFAARYGGEEFLVVLPHTDADGASSFAERLSTRLAAISFPHGARVTYSGGIASYPTHGATVEQLLRVADTALYQAKLNGKAHTRVAPAEKRSSPRHRANLAAVCFLDDRVLHDVTVRDISMAGVSLEADAMLEPGRTFRVRIVTPPSGAPREAYDVLAQVVWSRRLHGAEYRAGGRWAEADQEVLDALIRQLSADA